MFPTISDKLLYLCSLVTTEKPIQAMIYEVKRGERGDNFKKKISWAMRDLKVLDAKDSTKVRHITWENL